jgi:hypothetical protein
MVGMINKKLHDLLFYRSHSTTFNVYLIKLKKYIYQVLVLVHQWGSDSNGCVFHRFTQPCEISEPTESHGSLILDTEPTNSVGNSANLREKIF